MKFNHEIYEKFTVTTCYEWNKIQILIYKFIQNGKNRISPGNGRRHRRVREFQTFRINRKSRPSAAASGELRSKKNFRVSKPTKNFVDGNSIFCREISYSYFQIFEADKMFVSLPSWLILVSSRSYQRKADIHFDTFNSRLNATLTIKWGRKAK